jgi:DNA replication and repair protein RecF
MSAARIRRLTLTNFRSYRAAQIEVAASPVVLVGPNGAGKTNLIEAISFLAPGRGLRRATLDEVAFQEADGSWAVSAEVEGALGLATLGTGIEAPATEGMAVTRKCRIDREPAVSVAALSDHVRVVWLVPAMDAMFSGPASERRRFLDRLALAVDAEHSGRVAALERALRSRNRLLEEPRPDPHWLDAIEHETAEVAVAVAAQRAETVARLQQALNARDQPASEFPAGEIALKGWIEELVRQRPAIEVEDRYRAVLRDNRARDAAAGRTLDGPHLTDLAVTHARKGIPAADASTGEQKALLIGLILAHAHLLTEMSGFAPALLLDEVVAHLDPARRTALYAELEALGAQVWMTGADPAAFAEIEPRAQVFEVSPGCIARKRGPQAPDLSRPERGGDARGPGPGGSRQKTIVKGARPATFSCAPCPAADPANPAGGARASA